MQFSAGSETKAEQWGENNQLEFSEVRSMYTTLTEQTERSETADQYSQHCSNDPFNVKKENTNKQTNKEKITR